MECDKSVSNHSTVAFEINLASGKKVVSPENVATDILKYLLHKTAKFLGHSQVSCCNLLSDIWIKLTHDVWFRILYVRLTRPL